MIEWRILPSFPMFEVSEVGEVRRCKPVPRTGGGVGRIIKSYLHKGYRRYALCNGIKQRHIKACRLVIEAFVGPCPFDGAEVCHNDGDKTNDHYTNLRWDTHSSNMADRSKHGFRGEACATAKLTESQVLEIRRRLSEGEGRSKISKQFGVGYSAVKAIDNWETWKHLKPLNS